MLLADANLLAGNSMQFLNWLPQRFQPLRNNKSRLLHSFHAFHRSTKTHVVSSVCLQFEELELRLAPATSLSTGNQQLLQAYGQLPLSFEANAGQTNSQVQYLSRGSGYALFLTSTSAVLSLQASTTPATSSAPANVTGVALAMNLVAANSQATVTGLDQLAGTSNYFTGNDPSQWRTNVANYGRVEYQNVYPGVNLLYYGNQQQLEYDFVVAPGADPGSIKFAIQGADSISLDDQGNLVLHTDAGDVMEQAPVIYQEVGGVRQTVAGQFVLLGSQEVGFEVGPHDVSVPLVIDPVLGFSTYLGGSGDDRCGAIALDSAGNAYITGETNSTNFPITTGAFQTSFRGAYDTFVAKLNASGTALTYCTYLGGNGSDNGTAIALDSSGNAYITGQTSSTNFPITTGAFQTSIGGGSQDAFVAKLNASGTALVYSTYLGGSGNDYGQGIALDSSGNAYITGGTNSLSFPTTSGAFQTNFSGNRDNVFVTKLNASGTSLVYSTYLGGNGSNGDYGVSIAVDGSGNAYVTGQTDSTNFPTTTGAFQTSLGGFNDAAFVAKLNASGTALVYSTYLSGGNDQGLGIAVDASGNAYITGMTDSFNFPTTTGAFQTNSGGGYDAFVAKLNASGTALVYSTYLGGSGNDYGQGIALDSLGDAYITGITYSTNFPTTSDALLSSYAGGPDGFEVKLNASGTALIYGTYLGSANGAGSGLAIAVDRAGNAYITGNTTSPNFPTTPGAFQGSYGGAVDGFVAEFGFGATQFAISNLSPTLLTAGDMVSFTLQAEDSTGTIIPNYTGTVQLTSTDSNAVSGGNGLPGSYTFAASDSGAHIFTVMLNTIGSQTITVTDAVNQITATTGPIMVAGPFNKFVISVLSGSTIVAGNPFHFTVQATDQFGNPVSSGPANVTITASPADAQGNFPITGAVNGGFGSFLGTLKTAGTYTLAATQGSLSPTSITVTPGSPAIISVSGGSDQSALVGTAYGTTLSALVTDAFGNALSGVPVTFAAPGSGAGGAFAGNSADTEYTNASGVATSKTFTANGTAGSYAVTATVGLLSATFQLTNVPLQPVLQTPTGTITSLLPTFAWNAYPGAAHYDVFVTDLTTSQSPLLRNTSVSGTSYTFSTPLVVNHSYRWWVEAMGTNGPISPWSYSQAFSITPLGIPALLNPVGALPFVSTATLTPTFTWLPVNGANSYDVWVNDTTSGQGQVIRQTTANTSLVSPITLTLGHGYQWWVMAHSADGNNSSWGSGATFSLVVSSPAPSGAAGTVFNAKPTFVWTAVAGAAFYDVWVNDTTTGQTQVLRTPLTGSQVVTGTSWTASSALHPGDSYAWWVRAIGSNGAASSWSSGVSFTVALLTTPAVAAPTGQVQNAGLTFQWNAVANADYFDLWVDDTSTGTSQVLRQNVTGLSYATMPLKVGHSYRWWVRAYSNNGDWSNWSSVAFFTVVS
jgi:hypothetical protein